MYGKFDELHVLRKIEFNQFDQSLAFQVYFVFSGVILIWIILVLELKRKNKTAFLPRCLNHIKKVLQAISWDFTYVDIKDCA